MAVLWVIGLCNVVDVLVSEVPAASNMNLIF